MHHILKFGSLETFRRWTPFFLGGKNMINKFLRKLMIYVKSQRFLFWRAVYWSGVLSHYPSDIGWSILFLVRQNLASHQFDFIVHKLFWARALKYSLFHTCIVAYIFLAVWKPIDIIFWICELRELWNLFSFPQRWIVSFDHFEFLFLLISLLGWSIFLVDVFTLGCNYLIDELFVCLRSKLS